MPFQVTVRVTGLDETKARLTQLSASFNDWTYTLTTLGDTLKDYYGKAPFVSDGIVFGDAWRALKTSTINEKTRSMSGNATGIGGGAQPLMGTGALRRGFRFEVSPHTLFVDNSVPYWKYHQTGTTYQGNAAEGSHPGRGKNLPKRMTLGVNDSVKATIQKVFNESIESKIEAATS
jgi:hypothetical protein